MSMADMNLGMKCIKYMLLTVNAMFVLTATLILSIGTTIFAIYHDIRFFINDGYFTPASLLIAIGIIMLVVSAFGCFGAAKESTCMINLYALMLTLVFVLEIAAALSAYMSIGTMTNYIGTQFNQSMHMYHRDDEMKEAVDLVQENLECCGVYMKENWEPTPWYAINNDNPNATHVKRYPETCYDRANASVVNEDGCLMSLVYVVNQSSVLLGTGAMTIAFIQCVGIIFSLMLAKAIRQAKTDRERRRWEIREQMINAYTQMEVHQGKKPPLESNRPVIYVPTIGHSKA